MFETLAESGIRPGDIDSLILGSTVAINMLHTRSGARVLYLTTQGFEDVLFIQRINRRFHYDLDWVKPAPFAERRDCLGVRERISKDGDTLILAGRGGVGPAARGRGGAPRRGHRRRPAGGYRHQPAVLLCQPAARAGAGGVLAARIPRRARIAVARRRTDLAGVRARQHDRRRCLHQAARGGLCRQPGAGSAGSVAWQHRGR